jgi:hypothetical protein
MRGQNALKSNMVSFAQDHEHAIELLNELPLSLESISNFFIIHFVGNTHPPMEIIKTCNFYMYINML